MIPVLLNLADRLCVVIGGGEVGRRKARTLLEGGARVRLVCLEDQPADLRREHLVWIKAAYQGEHLDGAALVFAAATPELNVRVVADARARGVLVNAATNPETGDFYLPAVLRRGDLTVAVATGGQAPGVARAVRDWLAHQIDDSFAQWLEAIAELRAEINARTADERRRDAIFRQLCDLARLKGQPQGGTEEIRRLSRAEMERLLAESA
jgi:precorrin-2 dehydrogenase / sirohydrochlorin ferrochelatase